MWGLKFVAFSKAACRDSGKSWLNLPSISSPNLLYSELAYWIHCVLDPVSSIVMSGYAKWDCAVWTPMHQHAFDQIKLHVSNDVKLQFYDANKPLYIEVDMSKKGIGTVMLQEDSIMRNESKSEIPTNLKPISYASKSLSPTESNYSNIKHELLGLLFAVTHFKHFMYGQPVHIITDYKPLVSLFRKSLADSSPRLTRMPIQLLDYTLDVTYQPGAQMHLSDAISRLSTHDNSKGTTIENLDVPIHAIKELTGFNSLSVDKIHQHTAKDQTMQLLI